MTRPYDGSIVHTSSRAAQRQVFAFLDKVAANPPACPDQIRSEGRTTCGDLALDFMGRFGRAWTSAPLPASVARGPEKRCWDNARDLALRDPRLAYVEGFEAPTGHAYCVDATGTVVDPTWPADVSMPSYVGVAFDIAAVIGVGVRVGYYSSLLLTIDYSYPWLRADLPALLDRRWHPETTETKGRKRR